MPNKLTDTEIKKALEEHYKQVVKGYSTHLEYGGKGDEHEEKYIYMLRDVLDLINRQKSEIERLESLSERLGDDVELKLKYIYELEEKLETAKAEAYKEFAERLKERKYLDETGWSHGEHPYIVEEDDIDDVLEELVGEDK